MNTDLPLKNPKDDKLGRSIFANEIAYSLANSFKNNNESIVLGINGDWGSGKSTLVNFITNQIEVISKKQSKEVIILNFNPWMFSGQKELQNIFLKELLFKLNKNKEKLKNASKKIADFLEHLNWLKYVHSGAGEAVNDLKVLLDGLNKSKDLETLKSDIDKLLIESEVKLYITIDDIDRLTPQEITDIFQMVKLNGNFANTIFILAYDQTVVENALKDQFGENGKKYIEKIVQVDYTLPSLTKNQISHLFIEAFQDLFDNPDISNFIKENDAQLENEDFINFFNSLRDVYRFNNSIKLRLPSLYEDLNLTDFLQLECLRIFDSKAYNFILDQKAHLIHDKENKPTQIIDESSFQELTKKILKNLFVFNEYYFLTSANPDDLIRDKRIANKDYFDRYFSLKLESLDFKEITFKKFINKSIKKKLKILNKVREKKQVYQFLRLIEIKSFYEEEIVIEKIIKASLKFTDSLKFIKEGIWAAGGDFMTVQRFVSGLLDRIEDIELRRKIIIEHIYKDGKKLNFSSFFNADNLIYASQRLKDGKLNSTHMWSSLFKGDYNENEKFIKSIESLHKKAAKDVFVHELENQNLNDDELNFLLPFTFNKHKNFYNKKFPKLIEDDHDMIRYLWLSIKRNYMTSNSEVGYQLAKYQILPGLDIEKIKERIEGLKRDELDKNENIIIDLFIKAYDNGFQEKVYYNIKTLEEMGEW